MNLSLKNIEEEMAFGNSTPGRLAEIRVILSGKYAYASNQLEEVLNKKPAIWNGLRADHKSDTATERTWEATELGTAERHWRFELKKIEKMLSAAKTLIDVKTTEAYNLT